MIEEKKPADILMPGEVLEVAGIAISDRTQSAIMSLQNSRLSRFICLKAISSAVSLLQAEDPEVYVTESFNTLKGLLSVRTTILDIAYPKGGDEYDEILNNFI